jgi:putative sterol carrier protein
MPRVTSAQQIFDHLPEAFVPEQAQGLRAVIQFELTGDGGGEWQARIADGQVAVSQGRAESPTLTLTASAADYMAIVNGDLKVMSAFMGGRIHIQGDMGLAMKMQQLFRPPSE